MGKYAVYQADDYENVYSVVKKHFEVHDIKSELSEEMHVLIKPNLVTDKEAVFSVTTNPLFVLAIVSYLTEIGIKNITVADCPGGGLLLFSKMQDIYHKCGYDVLKDCAELNVNFNGKDIKCDNSFVNKNFNVIEAVADADYIINVPKFKTHNTTCITAAVKNIFGCIPGLQKPEFHAKYPKIDDFSNMLVELAAAVKPDFTIVDAIDIMEGNGPTNGKKRFLGLTFSSKDVFGLDKFIADFLKIPIDYVGTIKASINKGLIDNSNEVIGDTDFKLTEPIVLPEFISAETINRKLFARFKTLLVKIDDAFFEKYPQMNGLCTKCGKCIVTCPQKALSMVDKKVTVNKKMCIGCMCCDEVCPNGAVEIKRKFK